MPDISFDTVAFFEIILGGFMAVWVFRYFAGSERKYSEFEWFGLSAFWGLVILALWNSFAQLTPELQTQTNELLKNPFATGLTLSTFFSVILGYVAARLVHFRFWRYVMNFFGKGGEDDSGDIGLLAKDLFRIFKNRD